MKALSITIALALTMMTATSQAFCMRQFLKSQAMLTNQEGVVNASNIAAVQIAQNNSNSGSTSVNSRK